MANARVSIEGLDPLLARVKSIQSGQLQKDLVKNLYGVARPMLADMNQAAHTPIQNQAMGSVEANRISDGLDLHGGRGSDLAAVLFAGAEYGGRKSRKVTYMTRSPRGRSFSVRRRTTMQFLPHLGREGYFFWPTVREWLPKIVKQQQQTITRALGG